MSYVYVCRIISCLTYTHTHTHMMSLQPTGSKGWGIPKGGVEAGESLETAARREFLEETGISLLSCTTCQEEENNLTIIGTNSSCDCTKGRSAATMTYLEGSGNSIRGGKKIHAFVCNGNGEEVFISSNLIDKGFRKGQPENSGGRYMSIDEALHREGGVVHKNQRKLIELYESTYIIK